MLIQAFITESAVEAFDERILDGLAWLDEAELHALLVGPLVEHAARELRPVVQLDLLRCPALHHDPAQDACHPPGWERGVDLDRQTLAGEDVDDGQQPDPPAPGQRVADEVPRPALVQSDHYERRLHPSIAYALAFPPPHRQSLVPV